MAEKSFDSEVREENGWVIWSAIGKLDVNTSRDAGKIGAEVLKRGNKIILDMSRTTYLSSAGIRMILRLAQQAEDDDKNFAVCAPQERVMEVLELSGMAELLDIYDTVDEVIKD